EGAYEVALKLLPGLVKTAEENECVDISVEALTMLRNEYARLGKTTLYDETIKELSKQRKFLEATQECEELYYNTMVQINKSVSAQLRVLPKIPKIIETISAKANRFKSQRLDVYSYKLQLQHNQLKGDYASNVKLCTSIEKKYLRNKHMEVTVDLDKKEIAFNKLY